MNDYSQHLQYPQQPQQWQWCQLWIAARAHRRFISTLCLIGTLIFCLFGAALPTTAHAISKEVASVIPANFNTEKLSSNANVQEFIDYMVATHNFDAAELTAIIDSATFTTYSIASIQHPYEEQPWSAYRQQFVNPKRIKYGLEYWRDHKKTLRYAEKKYGVPAHIIVAIVGVESLYGRATMKHQVLDVLVTLGFTASPRASYFRSELEHYLLLTRELELDPTSVAGSYAGAIGLPQFMPSSYRSFALAYDPDNMFEDRMLGDLIHDTDDVIVSVANYLASFGWLRDHVIAVPAHVKVKPAKANEYNHQANKEIASGPIKPRLTIAKFKKLYHLYPQYKLANKTKATLIQLQNKDEYEYWFGLHNFYVLSRYNANRKYVMAVYQLAEELRKARAAELAHPMHLHPHPTTTQTQHAPATTTSIKQSP